MLAIEVLYHLGRARLDLLRRNFRDYAADLGEIRKESPLTTSERLDPEFPRYAASYITFASHCVPFEAKCLAQALALSRILRRRGYEYTVYFGVNTSREFKAHAWLRRGPAILVGAPQHRDYTVLASFAHLPGASPVVAD